MDLIKKLKTSITYESCNDIQQICDPLKSLKISYFNFVRIDANDVRISLINDQKWIEHFFAELYYKDFLECIEDKVITEKSKFYTLNLWDTASDARLVREAKEFDIHHGVSLIKDYGEYKDFFHFATNDVSGLSIKYLLNNPEVIKKFASYFTDRASKLIEVGKRDRWLPPTYLNESKSAVFPETSVEVDKITQLKNLESIKHEVLTQLEVKKIDLGPLYDNKYLTQKEFMCLKWCARGKSADEISVILESNKRTVEVHINNIKSKFNCHKISEAIYKASSIGILFD